MTDPIIASLMEKARELSELLEQTSAVREYLEAETRMLNSRSAAALRKQLEACEENTRSLTAADKGWSESVRAYDSARAAWREHPAVRDYFRAQERLETLLARLNAAITFPITGDGNLSGDENPAAPRCGGCVHCGKHGLPPQAR